MKKSTFRKNSRTTNPVEHFKNHLADADYSIRDFFEKYYYRYEWVENYRVFCFLINHDGLWTVGMGKAYSDFCLDFD